MEARPGKLKEEMNEDVKKLVGPLGNVSEEVKQINDKVAFVENRTEVIDKELEKHLALMQLREKEYCLRLNGA